MSNPQNVSAVERSANPVKRTPGPWRACNEGKCPCLQVWSVSADHPVCKVESGEWGDDYPSLRFTENTGAGSIGATVEAYMEQIAYGSIDPEVAEANARFIVLACNSHEELLAALKRILPMARDSKHEDFSDVNGNEDTRTAALKNALAAIALAAGAQS